MYTAGRIATVGATEGLDEGLIARLDCRVWLLARVRAGFLWGFALGGTLLLFCEHFTCWLVKKSSSCTMWWEPEQREAQ